MEKCLVLGHMDGFRHMDDVLGMCVHAYLYIFMHIVYIFYMVHFTHAWDLLVEFGK